MSASVTFPSLTLTSERYELGSQSLGLDLQGGASLLLLGQHDTEQICFIHVEIAWQALTPDVESGGHEDLYPGTPPYMFPKGSPFVMERM